MIGGAAVKHQFETISADSVRDRVKSREIAEEALRGLSDKNKVHFALKLILDTTDGQAAGTLSLAANRITEHAHILMREAFERECG
jgi:hypothetical protein